MVFNYLTLATKIVSQYKWFEVKINKIVPIQTKCNYIYDNNEIIIKRLALKVVETY